MEHYLDCVHLVFMTFLPHLLCYQCGILLPTVTAFVAGVGLWLLLPNVRVVRLFAFALICWDMAVLLLSACLRLISLVLNSDTQIDLFLSWIDIIITHDSLYDLTHIILIGKPFQYMA